MSHLFTHLALSKPKANSRGGRRSARRLKLLIDNPHCHHCGRVVVEEPGKENTATLIRDWLSCPDHLDIVGKAARDAHSRNCNPKDKINKGRKAEGAKVQSNRRSRKVVVV